MKLFSRNFVIREPLLVTILFVLTLVLFAFTRTYSRAYDLRRYRLAQEWFSRGFSDLEANRPAPAVDEFRTALLYDPQSWEYRSNLAIALLRAGHVHQAQEYFRTLWQARPEDGAINLQLARLAAGENNSRDAERFFNGAIFGEWPENAAGDRRNALFEFVDYYLRRQDFRKAESQLLSLSASLPEEPDLQRRVANLFLRVGDAQRALEFNQKALRHEPNNSLALHGAGAAAYKLDDFSQAQVYLSHALHQDPSDLEAQRLLDITQQALLLDSSAHGISNTERARRVLNSFQIATLRLANCPASEESSIAHIAALRQQAAQLQPTARMPGVQNSAESAEALLDFSFQVEQQSQSLCGLPSVGDQALLALASRHFDQAR